MMNRISPNSHSHPERQSHHPSPPKKNPCPDGSRAAAKPGISANINNPHYCIIITSSLPPRGRGVSIITPKRHFKFQIHLPNLHYTSLPPSYINHPLHHPSLASPQTNTNTPATKQTSLKGSNCNHFVPTCPLHTRPQPHHHVRKDEGPRHHRRQRRRRLQQELLPLLQGHQITAD